MTRFFHTQIKARAFSLIELLLVITIISVLVGVVAPRFFGRSQEAKITATRQMIVGSFGMALALFEQDNGRYPSNEEGLEVLIMNPQLRTWKGPYLTSASVPLDPWGNSYRYRYPSELTGSEFFYDVVSVGPDGNLGTADDITNHDINIDIDSYSSTR